MYEPLAASNESFIDLLWLNLTNAIKNEFGEIVYRNWLGHLKFKEYSDGLLKLTAPTKFIREWIETNYLSSITKLCERLGISIESISIEIDANSINTNLNENNLALQTTSSPTLKESTCDVFDYNLDPRFTFENFIVGKSNKVAYSAALAVSTNSSLGAAGNILYIHGAVGQGKTHLLQSVAVSLKDNVNKKVAYLSAEKFMHLYLKYMRANDLIGFKEKIKSCDVFLVDDLQFICGKVATQQEFSNLLSALTEANRMVVISSDNNPFSLQLDARSKSRLVGGFVVEITSSDYDLRLSILKSRAQLSNISIDETVLEFIATNITSSNREVEGALNKLIAYSSFDESEISLEMAQNLLRPNLESLHTKVDIDRILKIIAKYYNIEIDDITSKSRSAKFILPRQLSAYLAKSLTSKSLQEIGKSLGKRDHASVIYYIKQIEQKISNDTKLEKMINEISAEIKNL